MTRSLTPPFNEEAERAVLGAVLLSEDVWDEIGSTLSTTDFYTPSHRLVWQAMEEATRTYGHADGTTTLEVLRRNGKFNGQLRPEYFADLTSAVSSPAAAPRHAKIVRELSLRRRLLEAARNVETHAISGDDYRESVEDLVREVYRADQPGVSQARTAAEILKSPPDTTEALTDPPLFVRQGLTVLAAPSKIGKTNFWLYIAWAMTEGKEFRGLFRAPKPIPVLLVELELTEATVHNRLTTIAPYLGWDEGLSRFNVYCGRAIHVDDKAGVNRLAQIISSTVPRPELVIIDSYNAAISGDPDSTKESRKGLHSLRSLQERFGCSFGITCELRKPPPGQRLKYTDGDLKGNNAVVYDADTLIMLKPLDEQKKRSSVLFPALRHCDDLPENLVLERQGLRLTVSEQKESTQGEQLTAALREHMEGGGDMSWRACQLALRERGLRYDNNSLRDIIATLKTEREADRE